MMTQADLNYARIEKAIRFLHQHQLTQPDLAAVADAVGLSPFHLQRLFTEWAGVSPKQFLSYLTADHLKRRLQLSTAPLAAVAEDAGLSSPSRAHDLMVKLEAMTPQEFRQGGAGLTLPYGRHETPFGPVLLVVSPRGVTDLHFLPTDVTDLTPWLRQLRKRWPNAELRSGAATTAPVAAQLFASNERASVSVLAAGSPFQLKIWEALLRVPLGQLVSYGQMAEAIGQPGASQAVGGAVGANPVAYLIPCHRVIRQTGVLGEYRWGADRKTALLGWELSRPVLSA